jgi:hypothetical protein
VEDLGLIIDDGLRVCYWYVPPLKARVSCIELNASEHMEDDEETVKAGLVSEPFRNKGRIY